MESLKLLRDRASEQKNKLSINIFKTQKSLIIQQLKHKNVSYSNFYF